MGELIYINRGFLSAQTPTALLEYTDGDVSDLPVFLSATPAEKIEDESEQTEDKPQDVVVVEQDDQQDKPVQQEGIPWSTLENKWANIKYGGGLTRRVPTTATDIKPTVWHSNWKRCIDFARKYGVPMVYVWSNGSRCGHCVSAVDCMRNAAFKKNFMQNFKIVWCYVTSEDSGCGVDSTPYNFAWGLKVKNYRSKELEGRPMGYPFTNFYWSKLVNGKRKVIIDKSLTPWDLWEAGGSSAKSCAKKAASIIKNAFASKMKTYGYDYTTGQYK